MADAEFSEKVVCRYCGGEVVVTELVALCPRCERSAVAALDGAEALGRIAVTVVEIDDMAGCHARASMVDRIAKEAERSGG